MREFLPLIIFFLLALFGAIAECIVLDIKNKDNNFDIIWIKHLCYYILFFVILIYFK